MSTTGMTAEIPDIPPAEVVESATYGLPSGADSLADRIAIARIRTRRFLASTCRESFAASERALRDVRRRARRMRDERPMVLLGIIAGSAFALGITLRIWRSTRR